jgi:hypothetical protein
VLHKSPITTPSRSHVAEPILKTIVVAVSPERAFQVFTEEMSTWWPLASRHIGKVEAKTVVMDPFVGGRSVVRGRRRRERMPLGARPGQGALQRRRRFNACRPGAPPAPLLR